MTDVEALVAAAIDVTDTLQKAGQFRELAVVLDALDVAAIPLEALVAYAATTHHPTAETARLALIDRMAPRLLAERADEADALLTILRRPR